MCKSRPTAVAGSFYPANRSLLEIMVQDFLSQVSAAGGGLPKAIIAPHAGYIYSGPIAASVYAQLRQGRGRIERVVLLGPSHRVAFRGAALSGAESFATPLGDIPLDRVACSTLPATLPFVLESDQAHAQEHSLEVHLPFLQAVLGGFTLLPIVVGSAAPQEVAQLLDRLWGGDETLIVVSSDLSHYHPYAIAQSMDRATSNAIEALNPGAIHPEGACGRIPISGLLLAAQKRGLKAQTLDLRNSGDTAGSKDRVVGYGAYAFA